MERPEFGLVGSLSRLVDEERACGGVEQGLLRTSRGKSQTFSTVARCASPRLGARASECVSRGTTQFGNWHIAISRHTQRRGPKMGSGGLGRPVSGFRLRPRESRKAGARPGRRAPPVSRLFPLSRVAYRKAEEWGPSTSRRRPSPPRPHARAPPPGGLRGASEVAHEPQGHGRRREPRIHPLLLQLQLEPGRQWEQGQAPGPQQWRPCAVAGKAPAVRQEGGRRERDVPGVQPEHDRPHGVRADQVDLRPAQGWLGPAMAPQPLPRARARASG